MAKKCNICLLVNFPEAEVCGRCGAALGLSLATEAPAKTFATVIVGRAIICVLVCLIVLAGFYLSLISSAKSLSYESRQMVMRSIAVLKENGFDDETFLLENLAAYRGSDNWLNASVAKENAYAATNFPFEIVTIYPDFFTYPVDDVERAAILLHEARHLAAKDEHDAYEFVWKNRAKLGWTKAKYGMSPVWQNIRKQTKDEVPELFVCPQADFNDCTEPTDSLLSDQLQRLR